jgi:hypothetical protein
MESTPTSSRTLLVSTSAFFVLKCGVLRIGLYYNVSVVAEINPATQGKSLTEGKRGRRSKKQQEDDEKNGRSSPPDDDSVSIFVSKQFSSNVHYKPFKLQSRVIKFHLPLVAKIF